MAAQFTEQEWEAIMAELEANPADYGFPQRVYGSALVGSFNIRKLGYSRSRNSETYDFLASVCRQFDLIALQEVMEDLSGLNEIMERLGPEFGMVVSDRTGAFPGDRGVPERLAFVFRWSVVQRGEVVSDITYDRSKVTQILFDNINTILAEKADYDEDMANYEAGRRKTKPKLDLPIFLSFIRQPFCVSFQIVGHPGTTPYQFMAVNAHLIYGTKQNRKQEFEALMDWITERVESNDKAYYPNFMLLGDLNLDYDNPEKDYANIVKYIKSFDDASGEQVNVNFPFLDVHKGETEQYYSNVLLSQRYDQIGLFFREEGFPVYSDNATMGDDPQGPDYGVFNFTALFAKAVLGKSVDELTKSELSSFADRYEHKVSDHMPVWLRIPLPTK